MLEYNDQVKMWPIGYTELYKRIPVMNEVYYRPDTL